ncbi:ASB_HP2_G0031590.mRNA.1.CDS.1 [Saccharomyces cerevisiae]|nr:ASB_HP2_G0031590.mRNA.1.CDS.1 [Saccharomyces cerevisiae]CAI6610785.1 ASB_HP2_G0031590.mRNA.1.CDS.1 [Saccharomyces cerevisiae]
MSALSKIHEFIKVPPGEGLEDVTYLRNKDIIPMGPKKEEHGVSGRLPSTGPSQMSPFRLGQALLRCSPRVSPELFFGIRGSVIGIIIRIILSVVWFGSQAYLGSLCLSCVFASWSHHYLNLPDTIPTSVNMTTQQLIGFVVFQIISIPPLFFKPERFNRPLMVTCVLTFFAMMGITIWAVCRNGGSDGPLMHESTKMSSSTRGWYWVYGISSWYGSLSSGVSNQSDFTRFSKKTWSSLFGTIFSLMVIGTIIPLMGLVTASAYKDKYGVEVWMPNEIIMNCLKEDYSPKARAAAFFVGAVFTLSQVCFNTMGNAYAGGMDLSGLLPKYFNITRGSVFTALFVVGCSTVGLL